MSILLVQLSDVHLGRSFGGLDVEEDVRRELAAQSLAAVAAACRIARERGAAALLVPGDLFDRPEFDEDLYGQVRALFADFARPVLVSPGNHDAFGPASVWNRRTIERLGLAPWPDNVHVFETAALTPHVVDGVGDGVGGGVGDAAGPLVVHGHRVEGYRSLHDSPLAGAPPCAGPGTHVLLVHGALAGALAGAFPQRRTTAPFTAEQLAATGAHYTAAGHYHGAVDVVWEGRTIGAYAGVPVPGALDEDPHGGVLVVHIDGDGVCLERVETYAGRIRRIRVEGEPPFADEDDAARRIGALAEREAIGAADLLFAELGGFSHADLDVERVTQALTGRFRSLRITDATEPEGAGAGEPPHPHARPTVESEFRATLRAEIDACDDPAHRARLQSALRYGLLALRGRALRPPAAAPVAIGCQGNAEPDVGGAAHAS